MAYTEVSLSGYNSSPPTDDGASGAANTITWAKIKTKLGDPLNTMIPTVDDNVASACSSLDSEISAASVSIAALETAITAALTTLNAPSATTMLFVQTAAPTGWTKGSSLDDYALRLVSGTVSTGGSTAFTSVFASRTITTTEMPTHAHSFSDSGSLTLNRTSWTTGLSDDDSGNSISGSSDRATSKNLVSRTISATITFAAASDSKGSGTAMDFAVQYVDCIQASKN